MNQDYYKPRHSLHKGTFHNDGWFPNLDLEKLQKRFKIDSSLDIDTLFSTILQAVILTNDNLKKFAQCQQEKGYTSMAEVPTPGYSFEIPGEAQASFDDTENSYYTALYENAIFYRVKGDLTRENSHHTMLEEGKTRQTDYHKQSDDFYRQSVWAVRLIKGKRTTRSRLL